MEEATETNSNTSSRFGAGHVAPTRPLVWILVSGALVRALLLFWFHGLGLSIGDEHDYDRIAQSLVRSGEFAFEPGTLMSLRPPLYPVVVAGMYSAFGVECFDAVRLMQAALSLLNVVVIYRLGSELYSPRVGYWSSAFYCFYPSLLGFNNLILTETLFTLLFSATCWALVSAFQRDSLTHLGLAGVLMGLATLTRSVLWLFPPVLVLLLFIAWRGGVARRLGAAAVAVIAFSVVIAPWSVRNTRLQKTFVAVDVMGGRNFMMGNYEYTPLYRSWEAIAEAGEKEWFHVLSTKSQPGELTTQGRVDKAAMREGVRFVFEHPGLTLKRDLVKLVQFWGLERELLAGIARGYFGNLPSVVFLLCTLLILASYASAIITGAFGMIVAPPASWRSHALLLLMIAFVCGMHTLVFAHSRYHLPLMPIVLVYSAAALVRAGEIWLRRRTSWFACACVVCVLFIAGWLFEITVVESDRFLNMLRSLS